MAKVYYYLRTTQKKKDVRSNIRIKFRNADDYCYAKTPFSVETSDWDKKKQKIKQGRAHLIRDQINNNLGSLETHILDAWNLTIDKSIIDSNWLQYQVSECKIR